MIAILLFSTTPARAETIELRAPGRLTFREQGSTDLTIDLTLDADRFVIDRPAIDHCNTLEKTMHQCTGALGAAELRECESECGSCGPGLVVVGAAALIMGVVAGILVGVEAAKPRP